MVSKPPGQPTISKVLFFKQQSPKILYLTRPCALLQFHDSTGKPEMQGRAWRDTPGAQATAPLEQEQGLSFRNRVWYHNHKAVMIPAMWALRRRLAS